MHCDAASRPGGPTNLDRVYVGSTFAVVMDGASPFRPVPVDTGTYVDVLGGALIYRLAHGTMSLAELVGDAIAETADRLNLTTGLSPSAAIAIIRIQDKLIDTFLLGDCLITISSGEVMIDDRLSRVAADTRRAYHARLKNGYGYDQTHRDLLRALQEEEAVWRNVAGGYWIAEADPDASHHGREKQYSTTSVSWCVMATDGAYRPMQQLKIPWDHVVGNTVRILDRCYELENDDPDGRQRPRAKPHDDKTLAVITV